MATTLSTPRRKDRHRHQVTTAVDANSTSSVTPALFTGDAESVAMNVAAESGAHSNHVVTLQGSVDGSNFVSLASTVTGASSVALATPTYPWHRAKVTTAESGASVVTIGLYAKAAK